MKLTFEDLAFEEIGTDIRIFLYKIFFVDIPKDVLSVNSCDGHDIYLDITREQFLRALHSHLSGLRSSLTGKPAIYVHRNSGIPLIGNVSFGIVDRNSTLIEVKPITGCNLSCIYCSVDQDRRSADFVIEKDYLVEELKKLIKEKGESSLEIHINSNGEPLFYSPLVELVRDIRQIPEVAVISIDTNATLLTRKLADSLVDAGLTRFNISLNAIDAKCAGEIAGKPYDVGRIKSICQYLAGHVKVLIAPVYIPSINDEELTSLIQFAKSINADIGIQNFLNYKGGKNPVSGIPMEKFFEKLKVLEQLTKTTLVLLAKDFNIRKTKPLKKPFSKGDKIEVTIVCPGRLPGELIAAAKDRNITLPDCNKSGKIKVRITGDKHNIFYGEC